MKKYLLIVTLLLYFSAKKSLAQTNRVYDSIKALNLDYYASLPLDSFLHVIPQSYTSLKIIGTTRNNACGLSIYYSNYLHIWITPRRYQYMTKFDSNRVWNLTLFKKETAHYIGVNDPNEPPFFGQE